MFASRIALAAALLVLPLALPGAAFARSSDDEVVTTAAARATRPPTEAELAQAKADAQARAEAERAKPAAVDPLSAWMADAPPVGGDPINYAPRADLDVNGFPLDKDGKRQVHGEMGVSVGTGGYRSGYVSSLIPIGETGTLGVAVSQTDFGKHGGGYGYGGYGGGYGGYGGYGGGYGYGRGGTSQSLALSLDMRGGGSGRSRSDTPEGCAPGFRDGERYVEPVWVTQMRGDKSCAAATERP
ncbi:hypothetical protein [Caulobacter soli]|uniref:hypothetical protein n=1 Tax=Caulobacter soli TaxID=2708539 RepID=UPI0013EB30C7|nr:hypothetical protein [Caulobacter soli]